nr:hypothetical protein [Tanacetum cinerariifolium]
VRGTEVGEQYMGFVWAGKFGLGDYKLNLEDLEKEDYKDLEEDLADYPTDKDDDGEEESSVDDSGCSRGYVTASEEVVYCYRDRRSHARTARLMESEAKASCDAWVQSMDASDMARYEVRALQTTVLAQHTEIGDLRAADRR